MKALKWLPAIAVLSVSLTAIAAGPNNITVSHFEPLQRLSSRPDALKFDALGRTFDLQLEPNDRLLSRLSRNALTDGIGVYRGRLAGRPDSWARIVMYDGMPRGLVWDGKEMFAIEAPGDSSLSSTTPVIYRLADMLIEPGTMTCGVDSLPATGMASYSNLIGELSGVAAQGPGAVTEITVYAIGDYEFTLDMGGDAPAAAAITTRLNNVDGYFSQQVGVQISIAAPIETHTDPVDPFTKSDPTELLVELSQYREISTTQVMYGLTHLYTGRDLDTTTVGIAWRGALCQDYFGAGLSEGGSASGPTIDSLIAAHEIGHNFNAQHDGDPLGSCELEPEGFIMAPAVNINNDTFSACSVGVMQAWAAAPSSSCVTALARVDMSISLNGQSATVLLGADTLLSYDILQNGNEDATGVTADFTLPVTLSFESVTSSLGACTPGAGGVVNCVLGDVAGLSSNTIDIAVTPASVGVGMLSATVTSDTPPPDERPGNNQDDLLLTVNPAVDLVVNTPTAPTIKIDESTTISAVLENRSKLPAIGATLIITHSNGLQIDSISFPIGTCTTTTQQIECLVASFDAQSSSTLNVGVTGISTGSKSYSVTLSSNEEEANPGDNMFSGTLRVNSPKDSGGATGPLFLLLLAMFTVLARGRRLQRGSVLPR